MGDSMAEFNAISTVIADKTGGIVLPCSIGGTTVSPNQNKDYVPLGGRELAQALRDDSWDQQIAAVDKLATQGDDNLYMLDQLRAAKRSRIEIVVLWYGTNDFMQALPIDEFITDYVKCVGLLQRTFAPRGTLLVSPTFRWRQMVGDGLDSDHHPNASGVYLADYAEAIARVAALTGVSYLDLLGTNINREKSETTVSDGVHLDEIDQLAAGNLIAASVKSILNSNS